jgi:hypothetical protein
MLNEVNDNALTVTGPGDGGLTLRHPHFLGNRLPDGDEVVSLSRRPPISLRKIPVTPVRGSISHSDIRRPDNLGEMKNISWNRACDKFLSINSVLLPKY